MDLLWMTPTKSLATYTNQLLASLELDHMKHGLQVKVSQCLTYSMVSDHILKTIFIIFGRWVSTEICSYLCSFFKKRMGRELARGLFRNHIFLNYLIRLECNPLAYKNTCWVIDDFAIFLSYHVLFLGLGFYTATLHCQLNHNKIDGTMVSRTKMHFICAVSWSKKT